MSARSQKILTDLAAKAGVTINGKNPWDIQVKDDRLYDRVLRDGSLGFGEAYMDGWWECDQIEEMIARILTAELDKEVQKNWVDLMLLAGNVVMNKAKPSRAFEVGQQHYDVGNALYEKMLDKRMVYTCGYWKDATTLDEAQEAKLDLVARKLQLKPGDRVLDIGCGWGSFLIYAAEKYGITGVGVTVSKEQLALARKRTGNLPIEYRLQDYREVNDPAKFDKIMSLGMFEHVGYKNYDAFMDVAHRNLKDDGLFLLHSFGNSKSVKYSDPWFEKYIFPNSMIPSMTQVAHAVEKRFVFEDVHNFGYYYYPTLMAWFKNFDAAWPELKKEYDDRFYRMWKYYLLSAARMFKSRKSQIFQFVFSKKGVKGGYQSIR